MIGGRFKEFIAAVLSVTCCGAVGGMVPHDPRFGAMTHFAQGWPLSLVRTLSEGPLRCVRDEIPWSSVEEKKGKFAFPKEFDAYMTQLGAREIHPLIVLAFENENYDQGLTPYSSSGIEGYARYCVEVLAHYGNQIHEVEIWNEFNENFCKGPATRNRAEIYSKLLEAAYKKIKAARPEVTVLGGATAGVPLPYWEKVLAGGGVAYMDALSVHPYRFELPPEGLEVEIEALRELVKKHNQGKEKPIWVSEMGWGSVKSEQMGSLSIDEEIQAKFLVRAYALLLSAKVERIYWYLLQDYQQFKMGLINRDADGTPKLSYLALQTMIRELEGKRFVQRDLTADDVYSLLFSGPSGEVVRILWALRPTKLPPTAGDAVDMLGRPLKILNGITISDVPVFLHGSIGGLDAIDRSSKPPMADSARDFSGEQGGAGWYYGFYYRGRFEPMPDFTTTESRQEWNTDLPFLSISADQQHPSVKFGKAITSVRRWISQREGRIGLMAEFHGGAEGDGVGVSVLVDGKPLFRELLDRRNHFAKIFSASQEVRKGTTIDFAVDPGPGTNIDYDSTSVSIHLRNEE